MGKRRRYPSDMTDEEWAILDPLVPPAKMGGRPRQYDRREVVNAIRYLLRSGCSWRMLPHEFPPYRTVFHYFRTWRQDGAWERIHDYLRDEVRQKQGREASPSAGVMDSQSVKTTEKGG
jgi:putative transposase